MNARHSHDSAEWYTPIDVTDRAHKTMGGIDLDPASHAEANKHIWATRYFTMKDNGLVKSWGKDSVFINPPSGLVAEFWDKMIAELKRNLREAVWIGFSIEQLQTLQNGIRLTPLDFTMCVPKRRIPFLENDAMRVKRFARLQALGKVPNSKSQPSHANYITYIGPNSRMFETQFESLGKVVIR